MGYVDPNADLLEETGMVDGLWPCTGRRRQHPEEWGCYIELYDMRLDILQGTHVEQVQRWPGEVVILPPSDATPKVVGRSTKPDSIEERTCSVCGEVKETKRGRRVHESRAHGIKSERADYYKEWGNK